MKNLKKIMIKILMPVMSKLTPTCETITQKISESMDHKTSIADRIKIRIHLMGCKFCRRFEQQLIIMRKMIEKQPSDFFPKIKLSKDVKLKMKQKLQDHNHRH